MSLFDRIRQEAAAKLDSLRKENPEADRLATMAAEKGKEFAARARQEAATKLGSLRKDRATTDQTPAFVEAEYGVPHCKFERTPEGFKVHFNKTSLHVNKVVGTGNPLLMVGGGIAALTQKAGSGTNIEVTRDAVIIDGKRLARKDFGHFGIGKGWEVQGYTTSVLSYQYGRRSFDFGGAWKQAEATEVASALNDHLRATPMAGDEDQLSPEQLRASRPTDF